MSTGRMKYTIQRIENEVPLPTYLADCVDVPKFLAFCRECPNYGVHWSCAPFDFDPMDIWCRYDRLLDELLELEKRSPGSLALSGGSCVRCARCTRQDGKPCRFPERMRCSIEALGGDVGQTCEKYLHKPLLWMENGEIPAYMMTVGGLLLKEKA